MEWISCAVCGVEVPRTSSARKYCAACVIEKRHSRTRPPVFAKCGMCGDEFRKMGYQKYCGADCRKNALSENQKRTQKEWRANNKEKSAEYNRKYRDKINAWRRKRWACDEEYRIKCRAGSNAWKDKKRTTDKEWLSDCSRISCARHRQRMKTDDVYASAYRKRTREWERTKRGNTIASRDFFRTLGMMEAVTTDTTTATL